MTQPLLAGVLLAGAETPTGELQPWDVSPGIAGFWAFFALAAAVVVLGFFVVRQMRRVDQGARLRAAEEAAARAASPSDEDGDASEGRADAPEGPVEGR